MLLGLGVRPLVRLVLWRLPWPVWLLVRALLLRLGAVLLLLVLPQLVLLLLLSRMGLLVSLGLVLWRALGLPRLGLRKPFSLVLPHALRLLFLVAYLLLGEPLLLVLRVWMVLTRGVLRSDG